MLLIVLALLAQSVSLPTTAARGIRDAEELVLELADRNSYVMGPGDLVTVVVAGGSSEYLMAAGVAPWGEYAVGVDGYLAVSGIGAVSVDGLTIEEAQRELQRAAARFYPAIQVTISLKEPRSLLVSVGGMVNMPGTYVMTALDRVSDAVSMAEGISTYGSRRGIMLTGPGDTLEVDLNMSGGTVSYVSDPFLRNNSDIIFGLCSQPVFILSSGAGIETRELDPGDDVLDLLDRMGGVTGNLNLTESSILSDGGMYPVWTDSSGFNDRPLAPGDTVMIVTVKDSVMVGGAVSLPGMVAYNPENTVRDYIVYAGGNLSSSGRRLMILRNGREVEYEGDIREMRPMPGDVIELSYSWFERNDAMISLIISAVSLGITVYNVTN